MSSFILSSLVTADMSRIRYDMDNASIYDLAHTGSSYIVYPPVMNTDRDYLVLVDDLDLAGIDFKNHGWHNCLTQWEEKRDSDHGKRDQYGVELDDGARFQSWRSGDINVIVTDDVVFYTRSRAASELARVLNLTEKEDRIALFRCVKFGEEFGW